MDNEKPIVDFGAIRDALGKDFEPVQVLDGQAKVIKPEIVSKYSNEQLVEFFKLMLWERTLHQRSNALTRQGRLGFYAPTEGQEASEMGSNAAMKKTDVLMPAYRDIPQLIQHGLPVYKAFLWSRGHVLGNEYPEDFHAMPPQIIIGAQYVQAAGVALGIKKNGTEDKVAYTYTGDGGTSQGDFYEGMNFAGAFEAPAVFIVQNNGYAISVPRRKQTAAKTLAQKAVAAGIPSVQVDGMDFLAVYEVTKAAREYAAAGNGPVMIETLTYRFGPHTNAGDDPNRYRTKDEEQPWFDNDPLIRYRKYLTDQGVWSEDQENEYVEQVKEDIKAAVKQADEAPKQKMTEFLGNVFEEQPQNIQQQITEFQAKESK
ncbi:pyruvate dehydrogenase (acetyl-transferring) E1 component subunit alpha [Lactiplantibacillus plantarum]|uniref:pyruvate dehydrogenase (acetyl-transferring) E1 component subunit alpha n=1 Tax=Lactiplantibacillus plantarum TaxID=1590 RepID=UPI0012F99359|nr:pyruvate dehydrogenase (acetyl-transferring) E1 component subunit alpha [Lactiplantibacillus plantarum]KAE9507961.1 Pyruvate dehydrogenase E1 component subunit alpha [Lactiplantibacillus plantarum]